MLYNIRMGNNIELKTASTENVTISRAQYEKFLAVEALLSKTETSLKEAQSSNDDLKARVEWLEQVLKGANKARFGSKSEKLSGEIIAGMDSLFDEAEVIQAIEENVAEEDETVVEEHTRSKRRSKDDILNNLPEDTPVDVYEHYLDEKETICPKCGEQMEIIGKKEYKHLVIIPAEVRVRVDVCYTYACKHCPDNGNNVNVVEASRPKSVLPGSYASPEAIAYLMTEKFSMGSPLYRMQQDFERRHIPLSRQTMSNWMLAGTEAWLRPIYEELHKKLLLQDVLHADETVVQVLHEQGRRPQSKSYMWLYRTSGCAASPIVLYQYEPGRSGKYPEEFLKGYKGYLHSDGYEVYHNLGTDVVNVGCLIHARRKFHDIIKDKKTGVNQTAAKAVGYFTKIFNIEKRLADLSIEERYKKRLESEKPILDDLFAWANGIKATPKSKLGEALTYLNNQKKYLYNYLKDGRLEATNNRAERSIKPFVIARKNFLFANTAKGADGSAIMFSIIETAKENKLDPFRYLTYIFTTAPKLDQSQPNWIEKLLPENAPDECKTTHKHK